jgi:MFS family permease
MSFTSASRWSDVALGATARTVSYCGDFVAATALALTLQAGGDHGPGVAALLIAAALPLAVFGAPAGRLADRIDSRVLVVTTALVQAAVCVALAGVHTPVAMVALVAVLATGSALTQPAMSALTPEMVTPADLPRATSIMQTATTIGMLSGPALGGLLVGLFGGARVPMLVDAASFVVLAMAVLAIRARRGGRVATADLAGVSQAPQWTLRRDGLIRTLLISLAAVIASVTAMNVAEVFFVRNTLSSSPTMYGLIAAMWEVGVLFGVWPFARLKGSDNKLALGQLVILATLAVVLLGSATVPDAIWLLPLYFIGGTLNGGVNVIVNLILARRVPRDVRGRVGGTLNAVAAGANLAGYIAGGLLLPHLTPRTLIAGCAALSLVVALGFLIPAMRTGTRVAAVPVGVD